MGVGAFLEPLVVVVLLFGGTWINREPRVTRSSSSSSYSSHSSSSNHYEYDDEETQTVPKQRDSATPRRALSPSLLAEQADPWQKRALGLGPWRTTVQTPNTAVFRNRMLSRLLRRFPFLVECWYWALVYWSYQLGRAFTAVTLEDDTVDVARKHALQLIELEQRLHVFWELPVQKFFLRYPTLMTAINRVYSFIHIPGTIAFLVWLYYYTITRHTRVRPRQPAASATAQAATSSSLSSSSSTAPGLYQARRRTLAVCNLLAFVVFTLWPCMPPRLLSDKSVKGPVGDVARSYGFVDTVHSEDGASSVWTNNRFCNQYAAMPSLHFGYSLMIGLTIMTIPLPSSSSSHLGRAAVLPRWIAGRSSLTKTKTQLLSPLRLLCIAIGLAYPMLILVAIVATANHFILDAVAGAVVCGLGWWGNHVLLNLLPVEDVFLWTLRIHKPEPVVVDDDGSGLISPVVLAE